MMLTLASWQERTLESILNQLEGPMSDKTPTVAANSDTKKQAPARRIASPSVIALAEMKKIMDEEDGSSQARILAWLVSEYGSDELKRHLRLQEAAEG